MLWVFENQNCTGGVDQKCIQAHTKTGDTWQCIFAQGSAPFIEVPVFALQSRFDSWQLQNILGNTDNTTLVNQYGDTLASTFNGTYLETNRSLHGALCVLVFFHIIMILYTFIYFWYVFCYLELCLNCGVLSLFARTDYSTRVIIIAENGMISWSTIWMLLKCFMMCITNKPSKTFGINNILIHVNHVAVLDSLALQIQK
ncbi:hypothetical protein RFI_03620 [Reticulomyxa filosa]|uniref:Uncharacterized protein n=1 Tax=Reticulomyxa filosa TaxID=46433 RepID=X6P768_RETFI|nr:hypothetical protein RFI_03620 [Reticulomyxa filosa]|eukprot:ETO33482.1 hypothetical protein RFI_03620 [Reticulomyxa filosa]